MPWCVTCGYIDETECWRKASLIERRKAKDFPDYKSKILQQSCMKFVHQRISFIQYLKCKWHGHDCYLY